MLPIRCLNGKGHVISRDQEVSGWLELKPLEKQKKQVTLNLKLLEDGKFKGSLQIQSQGYEALAARKRIAKYRDQAEYIKSLEKEWANGEILGYTVENLAELSKPLIEKMEISMEGFQSPEASICYFNPFITERYEENPFKSSGRKFPVDIGVAKETAVLLSLELPAYLQIKESPSNLAIQLPQGGGRFLLNVNTVGSKVSLTNVVSFNKPVYAPGEYGSLREFYTRIIQAHQSQFVFKRK